MALSFSFDLDPAAVAIIGDVWFSLLTANPFRSSADCRWMHRVLILAIGSSKLTNRCSVLRKVLRVSSSCEEEEDDDGDGLRCTRTPSCEEEDDDDGDGLRCTRTPSCEEEEDDDGDGLRCTRTRPLTDKSRSNHVCHRPPP